MTKLSSLLFLVFLTLNGLSQTIDGDFAFQSDPAKKYSIYVPSSYNPDLPSSLMVGLHPLNTNRWDAKAWRDTLVVFAETNNLLLVCPDGGINGKVDDDIDTAFTSILIDSMEFWYNVDPNQKYLMGFSWGGKTSYTYGLRRTDEFRGYLIMGAAVAINEVADVINNAEEESFYLVHGSQDNQAVRYDPLLSALEEVGACVESNLLAGIGHTIDFPERNNILTDAFLWLQGNNCLSSTKRVALDHIQVAPNPFQDFVNVNGLSAEDKIEVYDVRGASIEFQRKDNNIYVDQTFKGHLVLRIIQDEKLFTKRLIKL